MADPGASLDVKAVEKLIASLGAESDAMGPTMAVAAEMLVAEVQDRWRSAGDGTWAALSPSTLEKRRGTRAQILIDTARGISSVRADSGPDFAEAATDTDYMKYHCGDAPRTRIPLRDPFDISDEAHERVMEFVLGDLVARWSGSTAK